MLYLLIAILAGAGVTLIMKAVTSHGLSVDVLNFFYRAGMGFFAICGLFISFPFSEWPALFSHTWAYMLPGTFLLYVAGPATMQAVSRGHVGMTAAISRSSMVLPVAYSLGVIYFRDAAHFYRLLPIAGLGCILIIGSFLCFGLERDGLRHVPNMKTWLLWLALAFFSTGGWDVIVAMSAQLDTKQTLFCYYGTSLGAALLSSFKIKTRLNWQRWSLFLAGVGAGLLALIVALARPLAVAELGGLLVFPTTSIVGLLVIQISSAIFWKHYLSRAGWIGLALAAAGIGLLATCK